MNKNLPRLLLLYRLHSSSFTAIPWVLARSGQCQLDMIAPAYHMIAHSAWIARHIQADTDDDFIEQVCRQLQTGQYHAMLCIDIASKELVFTHAHRPELRAYLPFAPESKLLPVSLDKIAFHEWCDQLDFPTPRTVSTRRREEITVLAKQFDYPFILKSNEGGGGIEIDIIANEQALLQLVENKPDRKGWILQEYVEGEVGTTTFIANRGQLFASFSVFNRACLRGGLGPAAICEFIDDPQLAKLTREVIRKGNLSGFTGFDWIRSKSGKYYLIDPHFGRTTPGSVIAHLHGIDLGAAYLNSIGIPSSPAPLPRRRSRIVWIFPQIYILLLSPGGFRQLANYSPFRKDVALFFCGTNDGILFRRQSWNYLAGRFRVLLGKWRIQLLGRLKLQSKPASESVASLAKPAVRSNLEVE